MSTIEVPLSNGRGIALIDECDSALVLASRWSLAKVGYALGWRNKKNVYMHRLILGAVAGQEVDHINGSRLDNRRCNLRFVDRSQNNANARKRGSNRFKGTTQIRWRTGSRWVAQIAFRGEHQIIGYFDTDVEAAQAYDARARELFGEFARTNF